MYQKDNIKISKHRRKAVIWLNPDEKNKDYVDKNKDDYHIKHSYAIKEAYLNSPEIFSQIQLAKEIQGLSKAICKSDVMSKK